MRIPIRKIVIAGVVVLTLSVTPTLGSNGANEELTATTDDPPSIGEGMIVIRSSSLLSTIAHDKPKLAIPRSHILVTAYSSTPEQTDDTPFITAAGTMVRDGIVATNMLPLGTRIKLPDLYGERVFVVEDRMHPRKRDQVDIWFPSYGQALQFGVKKSTIEILER